MRRKAASYAHHEAGGHDAWQLAAFNRQWRHISTHVPHWEALKQQRALPEQFDSLEHVFSSLPLMERVDLQTRLCDLYDPRYKPDRWRATGGSTGQPVRIPIWCSEVRMAAVDMWYARSWFDISPSDRAFLIWGHSHLLGHGLGGWLSARLRSCKDWLLGYYRWSAYRMSDDDLQEAGQQLLRFRPQWVLGYSVALDRFARVNQVLAPQLRSLRMKAVIATAESFPFTDSRDRVERTFGCPVVMEYGAVESGPIAHECPGGGYRVFWRRHLVEAIPSPAIPGAKELVLTSLYPRCLPLIRYRIGDLVVPLSEPIQNPLMAFGSVLGRCNDTIVLPDGRRVHSEAVAHILRDSPVTGYQLVQHSEHNLTLRYTSINAMTKSQMAEIQRRLERVDAGLTGIRLERRDILEQTVAGKTRQVCNTANAFTTNR